MSKHESKHESKYEELFLKSSRAYDDKDYDGMMSFVTEDYEFYSMTDEGPQLRAKGKEQATAGLKMVLESDAYIKGDVEFLKTFGNVVVALEKDQFREGDEVITHSTLGIYQYKGDKLARAYTFPLNQEE
jgi:hypothetical protein